MLLHAQPGNFYFKLRYHDLRQIFISSSFAAGGDVAPGVSTCGDTVPEL